MQPSSRAGGRPPPPPSTGDTRKVCFDGTHRVAAPAETLRRIEPLFDAVGITRLADVTWLDEIGIPVYQAVRPNSWTLSVTQGKGLTPELAKVSAAMEAIEGWHAERQEPGELRATVAEMERTCGYRIAELRLERRHHLSPATVLEWTRARRLGGGPDSFVPTRYVQLDGRVAHTWRPPLFTLSSNGLGSGNTLLEAALHGLYELIERDAQVREARAPVARVLDLGSVGGTGREVIDQLSAAGVAVHVEVLPSPTGLPCFHARIWSELFPVWFGGAGCHADRDVALCRALTEAAQSRITTIAGTRDDIAGGGYRRAGEVVAGARPATPAATPGDRRTQRRVSYDEVETVRHADLSDDLDLAARRVTGFTGRPVLLVDHTRAEVGIPVVRVVAPGLLFDPARG